MVEIVEMSYAIWHEDWYVVSRADIIVILLFFEICNLRANSSLTTEFDFHFITAAKQVALLT